MNNKWIKTLYEEHPYEVECITKNALQIGPPPLPPKTECKIKIT
jgi:hypothetical protein